MVEKDLAVGQFDSVTELIAASFPLQISLVILFLGIVTIVAVYKKFSKWIESRKIRYTRPHLARFFKTALLPFFAIALITSVNAYIQASEFLEPEEIPKTELTPQKTFAKILNTVNILVVGYSVAHLVPIFLDKYQYTLQEKEDFEEWEKRRGFPDDEKSFFFELFEWIPPRKPPDGIDKNEFEEKLKTSEGRSYLQEYRTPKGSPIGTIVSKTHDPFKEWQKSEYAKYRKYFDDCISGNNETGRPLNPGATPQEIFPIDQWKEEKRLNNYETVKPGAKPPGYAKRRRETMPKSLYQIIPTVIFAGVGIGVISWWGVDLFVVGTAIAGLGVGIGFALKETLENFFAYLMIRKDKIFVEGDRVLIEGYNGYIHKITTRVTYIKHGLYESIGIFPTRQLIATKVINFTKEFQFVPAFVQVGVSYLHDPKDVAAILNKVGQRAMSEFKDNKGSHLIMQQKCPYLKENKPSCGCDKGITDLEQPWVLFTDFNDSALEFDIWVYVRDYGTQFEVKSKLRMVVYEEFKKHDIKIPWPIRTLYQGDIKSEESELALLDDKRKKVFDEYGPGDMNKYG